MDDLTEATVGKQIAASRRHAGLTRGQVATAVGLSEDMIKKIEQGSRGVTMQRLREIAAVLDLDPRQLLPRSPSTNDGPTAGAVAIRRALTSMDDLIAPEPVEEPVTIEAAHQLIRRAWAAYWGGQYPLLGVTLPTAIEQLRATAHDASSGSQAAASEVAAVILQIAACTMVQLGHGDVAHLALREALRHAASGDDELLPLALRGSLSWVLLTQGRAVEAHRLAVATAQSAAPAARTSMPAWTVYGALQLTGATAAARAGDRGGAGLLLDEAAEAATQTGARNDYQLAFGPHQVQMQRIDVEIVTGRYESALTAAREMPAHPSLPPAARARHLSDVALACAKVGRDSEAVTALQEMLHIAPTWARFQPQPRLTLASLRRRVRGSRSELDALSQQISGPSVGLAG